jgi:hypothetical protein
LALAALRGVNSIIEEGRWRRAGRSRSSSGALALSRAPTVELLSLRLRNSTLESG